MRSSRRALILATSLLACSLVAWPRAGVNAQSEDPGVAFVSTLNGDVSVQRGDSGDVVAAGVNAPLMVGDYVSTAPNARAEIQFDYGHVVRIAPNSQIRFAELGRRDDTVQLAAGSVGVGVLHATSQFTQVETPSVTVRPREAGFYRVAVDANGVTEITVRSGNAAILLPNGTRWLDPGSTMLVWGPADNPSFRYERTRDRDSFDAWNNDRDAAFERANAYQYASSSIPGLYVLAGYGQWQNDPTYGNEWIPNVAPSWSPYGSGQWTYEPYYGWTWVDNAPWGYAPTHYGRWHHDSRRNCWAWTPGPRQEPQQSWSPALVAFIGFGGGAAIGSIGWVPLAPNEQPHPWWGSAARSYNTTTVTNVQHVYVNAQYPNAVHGMPRQSFAAGEYQHIAPVSAANYTHAVVMHAALPVVPGPQTQRYTERAPVAAHAPSAQAFHAFKVAPQTPQTFTQQRAQAAVVTQHAPAAVQYAHPQPVAQPARPAPVVHQQIVPAAAVPAARPAYVAPARPAPAVQQAHPAAAVPAVRPAYVAPARPAPAVQQARPAYVLPARPAPAVQQARPAYVPPARPAPAVPAARPAYVPPARPAPAVPAARPAYVPPARPAPAVPAARPAYVPPARPAPAVQQARPAYVAPVRPAPAVQQARPAYVPPAHAAPVRPAPAVKAPPPSASPAQ